MKKKFFILFHIICIYTYMCIHLNAVKNNKLVSIRERQRNKETGIEINKKKEGQKFSGINSYIYVYIHIE